MDDQPLPALPGFDLSTPEGRAERLRVLFWETAAACGNDLRQALAEWRAVVAELEKRAKTLPPAKPRPIAQSFAWDEKIQRERRMLDEFLSAQALYQTEAARDGRKPVSQGELIERTIETLANPDKTLDPITASKRTMERLLAEYASQTRN
jgi:hypothetical protein